MLGATQIWDTIETIVKAQGLELFDLQVPSGNSGTLRVFIWGNSANGRAVTVGDCAKVSKRISMREDIDAILPGDSRLEVSSPGVNRELRRKEHFATAVGERVRVSVSVEGGANRVVLGKLESFDGSSVRVKEERGQEIIIPLRNVLKARVEYLFE